MYQQVSGPTDGRTLNTMIELAISLRTVHRIDEAIALEEESLRLKREHLPAGHKWTLESLENLAAWYEQAAGSPRPQPYGRSEPNSRPRAKPRTKRPTRRRGPRQTMTRPGISLSVIRFWTEFRSLH